MVKINTPTASHNISTQYGFLLYEATAKVIGIDMISQETLKNMNSENIIKVQLGSYLHYLLKVIDENEGRKARTTMREDVVAEEDSLRKALSIDFNEEETERLLKNIKLIYGINAVTSTEGNTLYDWDLIVDKRKSKMLGLFLKNNNKELCNLNYPEEKIETAYQHLNQNNDFLPEYIDEIKPTDKKKLSMYESADRFLEIYEKNPDYFKECIAEITGIDPQQIVSMIKNNWDKKLPEAYSWWFCATMNLNKEYLNNKLKENSHSY